jgi:hypothetical protein
VKRIGIFLITLALIAGMVGCVPVQYTLTITSTAGGNVTTPGVGNFTYGKGTVVNLVAKANAGYHFVNWTGNLGTVANVTASSTNITMNGDYSITANFAQLPRYSLSMKVAPAGSGTASDVTNASPYTAGTVVNIRAVAAAGYRFANWTAPAGTFGSATAGNTTFTIPAQNVTVTANFVAAVYNLTMAIAPGGSGNATDLTNASPYTAGTVVSIRAVPNKGYMFFYWTAPAGAFGSATAGNTTFTMPAQNVTVTANFVLSPPAQHNLTISSTAGGLVTTPGEGLFTYDAGTVDKLVAEAEEGYQFVEWTGNVSTISDVNAAATNITMNGDYSITANFGSV